MIIQFLSINSFNESSNRFSSLKNYLKNNEKHANLPFLMLSLKVFWKCLLLAFFLRSPSSPEGQKLPAIKTPLAAGSNGPGQSGYGA